MSPTAGFAVYYGILGAGALALAVAALWALLLGLGGNRRSSRDRNVLMGTCEIRGTAEDTLAQIEQDVRQAYREPMEIVRGADRISFRALQPQPLLRCLRRPLEHLVFTVRDRGDKVVVITYSATLGRFRRLIARLTLGFIVVAGIPVLLAAAYLAAVWVLPAFAIQGDLTPDVLHLRRQVLHVAQVVHVIWPPYVLLALYAGTTAAIRREFNRFLGNIQYID